ncbi:hypothetical protein BC829DRAFT_293034 [Chytridium lagenaria]|nr:hypothetical protein BC829DRAFT_293034 [Chytridium lagenaria]
MCRGMRWVGICRLSGGDGLKGLEVMRMAWCGLTGKYPEAWVGMEKLTELILNRNNLTGFLPTFTKNLTIVDISHNDFSGEIPESFVNAWGLVSLDIGWNRIWGRIPSSWRLRVDSGVLKSFSIGYNQLIGIVPPFVSMAPQFNISGNCFTLPPNVHDAFPQNDSTRLIPQFSNCPLSSDSKPVPSSNPPTLAIALSVTATLIFAILLAAAFIIIRRRRRTREAKIETPNLISSYIDTPRSSTTTSTPSSKAEESSLFSNLAHRTPSQRWISTPSSAAGSVKGEPSALFGNLERGSVSGSLVVPLMKTVEGDCADWGVEEVEGWLENSGVNKNISTMFVGRFYFILFFLTFIPFLLLLFTLVFLFLVASGITGRALLNLDDVALRDMGFAQDEVRSMILLMVYALKNKRQGGLMVDGPPAYNGDEESVVGSSVLVEASEGKTDTVVSSEMGRGMTVGSSVGVSEMGRSETVTSSELWRAVTVGSSVSGSELGTGTVVSEVGRSESVPSVEALEESESGSAGRMETLVTEAEDRTEIARVDTRVVGVKNIEEINGMSRGVSDLVVQSPDVSAVTTSRD